MDRMINKRIITLLLVYVMLFTSIFTITAANVEGNGGKSYEGPTINDFAAGMPLTEVYFIGDKFNRDPDEISIVNNPQNALVISDGKMKIDNTKLAKSSLDNGITGQYTATWKEAAILPDGSKKDVTLTFNIGKIATAYAGDFTVQATTTIFNNQANGTGDLHDGKGINICASLSGGTGTSDTNFVISVEQNITINVDGGEFVVPINGINQNRNNSGTYKPMRTTHEEAGYNAAIETVIVPDSNIFQPTGYTNYSVTEGTNFIDRGGKPAMYDPSTWNAASAANGSSGSDGSYLEGGFATIGSNGFTLTSIEPCGSNASSSFGNNAYIVLGDLIHRIWSGSGPNGKIETDKKGDTTGAVLAGGSFTGDIPTGRPDGPDDLKRYVVPDGKKNVTYTMTPNAGYFADEISVDDEKIKIPMDQPAGTTWEFAAGTLKHEGNDIYTFVFKYPNATDHSIYVTWRTTPAADDVVSYGEKGETQTGTPIFKAADGKTFNSGDYILIDDNGNEVDSITIDGEGTYTINKDTGEVTFVPEPDFVGPATGVKVRATQEDDQTVIGKYTPNVVDNEEEVTKTQNITYYYDDGSPVLDDDGNPLVEKRTHTYTRKGKVNPTTGEVTWDEWTAKNFDDIISPDIDGYLPDKDKVDGGNFTPNNWPEDEKVIYSKEKTIWVTYIDEDGTVYKEKTKFKIGDKEPSGPSAPKKGGYIFDGWDRHVDKDGNITYIAKWKKVDNRPVVVNTGAK